MTYIRTTVDVDIDDVLSDIDTDDLIKELEGRGMDYNTTGVDGDAMRDLLEQLWLKRRNGVDYQNELDKLIYNVLGKVI